MTLRSFAAAYFWSLPVMIVALLIGFDALVEVGFVADNGVPLGRDFANVWLGGRLALEGNFSCLYDSAAYNQCLAAALGPGEVHEPRFYSYPPHSLFLAAPFGLLPYVPAFILWSLLTGALFAWAARPYLPAGTTPLLAVATPAGMINLWSGQYGFLIGALWLMLFAGHRWSAALLTIKPHLGVLLPAVFLWRRWGLATAILGTVGLVGASVLVFGLNLWPQYYSHIAATHGAFITSTGGNLYERMMTSPMGVYRGTPAPLAFHIFFVVSAIALWWQARNAPLKELTFISATATVLIIPYSHNYDLTVAGLGFGILLLGSLRLWERTIIALAYLLPLTTMFVPVASPPLLLAALWIQVRLASEQHCSVPARAATNPPKGASATESAA